MGSAYSRVVIGGGSENETAWVRANRSNFRAVVRANVNVESRDFGFFFAASSANWSRAGTGVNRAEKTERFYMMRKDMWHREGISCVCTCSLEKNTSRSLL